GGAGGGGGRGRGRGLGAPQGGAGRGGTRPRRGGDTRRGGRGRRRVDDCRESSGTGCATREAARALSSDQRDAARDGSEPTGLGMPRASCSTISRRGLSPSTPAALSVLAPAGGLRLPRL